MKITQNLKVRVMIAMLLVIAFWWLADIEITAFQEAVSMVTPIFTQFIVSQSSAQIDVPEPTVVGEIRELFGPQAKLATAIFTAESGLNCASVSKTGDIGVAQINHAAHPQYSVVELLDCRQNLVIAHEIYAKQGNFTAWSAYKNGSYKKFYEN